MAKGFVPFGKGGPAAMDAKGAKKDVKKAKKTVKKDVKKSYRK